MTKKKKTKKKFVKRKPVPKKSIRAKAKKKPSAKKSFRTKAKQKASAKVFVDDTAVSLPSKPEPKNKLVLEYIIYASPKLLYEFISSPSGLSEWFADDVNNNGNVYTFVWDGAKQEATVIHITEGKSIRLRWTDRPADTYFEFSIEKNELTHELSLIITDFAESDEDKNSLEVLWQGQVQRLMKVIGSKV